ncbi:MAG TPA: type II toxin-antitoxin system Phd/YefM family antitoxin [Terriglobia bacterium]|nr:type II toxin-antitoxin system Phd/YefM family antitoxin [Terriglobia bacterium]
MTIIRSITDLRNHASEIIDLCKRENQPVYITKNGMGEVVVMSQGHYDQLQARLELYDKLGAAKAQVAAGARRVPHRSVMATLTRRIREKKF